MSIANMGAALSEEEFQQLQDVVASASDDTTKPQLALSFFKERETGKGNRKAHLSISQLSHLVSLTTSFETKKSLVLLLAPYLCADASNYKAIVDLFPSASDRTEITNFFMVNSPTKLLGDPSASSTRTDLGSLNPAAGAASAAAHTSASNNGSNNVFPMPQPRRREDLQQQQQTPVTPLSVASGIMQTPVMMDSPMDLSSSSDDESSRDSRGGGGSDDGSSCNGGESRGGSTLNSQEDLDELGGAGGGGREGGGGSPMFGASSTASIAPSVLSYVTSGGGGGGGSSLAGGPTPSVVDSLLVVGSVATTLSSYDSTGSLSTIESSASTEVSQRRPFQHRSSLLKPVSEPSGGGGGGGVGDEDR